MKPKGEGLDDSEVFGLKAELVFRCVLARLLATRGEALQCGMRTRKLSCM